MFAGNIVPSERLCVNVLKILDSIQAAVFRDQYRVLAGYLTCTKQLFGQFQDGAYDFCRNLCEREANP